MQKLILYQGWYNILLRSTGRYWFLNAHQLQDFNEVFFSHLLQVITLHLQRDFNFSWMFLKLQALHPPKFTAGWFMLLTNQFYENLTWSCEADEYVEVALKMLVTLNCFSIYIVFVHVRFFVLNKCSWWTESKSFYVQGWRSQLATRLYGCSKSTMLSSPKRCPAIDQQTAFVRE